MASSPLPAMRPLQATFAPEEESRLLAMSADILNVVTESNTEIATESALENTDLADVRALLEAPDAVEPQVEAPVVAAALETVPTGFSSPAPVLRPNRLALTAVEATSAPITAPVVDAAPEVVTRLSTSGSRHWGINIGTYGSEYEARKVLLKTALTELETLDGALRKVVKGKRGYNANFLGLTEDIAALTCRKLEARGNQCSTMGPS
jgi:D-alanyl-D-alanine carboxypeptidase